MPNIGPVRLLLGIEGLSSLFGFMGGIPLTIDPSGKILGVPLSILTSLPIPIHDFLLPGLWLLLVYGVGLALTAYFLRSRRMHAWFFAMFLSLIWLGWITFEMIFVGSSILIAAWYLPQAMALVLLMTPAVRHYEAKGN